MRIKAVNLRHIDGREEEAEEVFACAFAQALGLNKAIAAYVLNDWASMRKGYEALDMISRAITLLEESKETPDPDRHVEYDKAYFRATRARTGIEAGIPACLKSLTRARRDLKQAAKTLPRYKDAYFNALGWECEAAKKERSLHFLLCAPRAGLLAWRQGKVRLIINNLRRNRA